MEHFLSHSDREVYLIGVDESVTSGYSHVALLTSVTQYVIHNGLIATNRVKYSGKSLNFRLNNPRKFHYTGVSNLDVILVDDIVTTGTTLLEAKEVLEQNGVNVLFGLTLADVLELNVLISLSISLLNFFEILFFALSLAGIECTTIQC
jgi:competence protein ComFC